jgi:D-sedoheptulose 7-phosphate isomerase
MLWVARVYSVAAVHPPPRGQTVLYELESRSHRVAADYLVELGRVIDSVSREAVAQVIDLLLEARRMQRRVYIMGNGGSSATASHLASDLVKTARVVGLPSLRAFALTDNVPLVTAWANDADYEDIFAEQITAFAEADDVVIAISASGNSDNIIAGLRAARANGARTIGMVGFDGGAARELVDVAVHVPCHDYGLVEDVHLAIGHAITKSIRHHLELASLGSDDIADGLRVSEHSDGLQ